MKLKAFFTIISIFLLGAFIFVSPGFSRTFKEDQLRYERVRTAVKQNELHLKKLFADQGLKYPPDQIFIRVFKQEKIVELWAFSKKDDKFHKVTSYPICSLSGTLGPKRQEGDLQVPEGFYSVDRFNPASRFYLSLSINYPNAPDSILGVQGRLGGEIFIHGDCVTIGCVPITDDLIKELYLAALEATSNGQKDIPVHIFPARLSDEGMAELQKTYSKRPELISFWETLRPGYAFFEKNRKLPHIQVNNKGEYALQALADSSGTPWEKLDKGLFLAEFATPLKSPVCNYPITVLKIDPRQYRFTLICASEHGGGSKTAKAWADQFDLVAAINASMYAADHKTSTGYMKNFTHTNKHGVNPKFRPRYER